MMDETELKFENIYNPMIQKTTNDESNSKSTSTEKVNCCKYWCNFLLSCFICC